MGQLAEHGVGVDPSAAIHASAEIGPYCRIGPDVRIGRGTRLENQVTVWGRVTIGEGNHFHTGVVIGERSSVGQLEIGHHNVIRECVTLRPGRSAMEGATTVGDHNFLMACCHVESGCRLGNRIVIANASNLAPHARISDSVFLSGGVRVKRRVRIGRHAFVSILSTVGQDVPPFMMMEGEPPRPRCVNLVGLKRHGFSATDIQALVRAHRLIYRQKMPLPEAFAVLQDAGLATASVGELFDFVQAKLNLCRRPLGRDSLESDLYTSLDR
jgi:UDP-N-acetylglucosamine acyltransferase